MQICIDRAQQTIVHAPGIALQINIYDAECEATAVNTCDAEREATAVNICDAECEATAVKHMLARERRDAGCELIAM